jgi:hypothetical protein
MYTKVDYKHRRNILQLLGDLTTMQTLMAVGVLSVV